MKSRMNRGFTLIELLVVMVILGILVALALPNYIRARDKAKETQVKSGIRIIQLAIERYAADNGGYYPTVVLGGDQLFNVASMDGGPYASIYRYSCNDIQPFESGFLDYDNEPFDLVDCQTNHPFCIDPSLGPPPGYGTIKSPWNEPNHTGVDRDICMDMLLLFGYLSEYPKNPFMLPRFSGTWAAGSPYNLWYGGFSVGGRYGNIMFDLGFGRGEAFNSDFWANDSSGYRQQFGPPNLDVPGEFAYHPVFCDGETVQAHIRALVDPNSSAGARIPSHAVCGYTLVAFGSVKTLGMDYYHRTNCETGSDNFNNICWGDGFGGCAGFLTGYPSNEPDPLNVQFSKSGRQWYCSGIIPLEAGDEVGVGMPCTPATGQGCGSGPDGNPDQIVTLVFGGLDRAPARGR